MFASITLIGMLLAVRIALCSKFCIFIFKFRINSRLWKNSRSDDLESNFLGIWIFIYLAIFCNSLILWSSWSLLGPGPFKELVLLVVVMARESLLFLKIRRIILLIVAIALLILWLLSVLGSHSWYMCTRCFWGSCLFAALAFLPVSYFASSPSCLR